MAIVSYRIYCNDCDGEQVIRDDRIDESAWKVESRQQNAGLCPSCNPAETEEYCREDERVPFEKLDNVGEAGAENLREAGIITRGDVKEASDEEILDVSWIGDGGLSSIRKEVQ